MEESELTLNVLNKVIDLTRYFSQSEENMVMLSHEIEKMETFLSILELRFQKGFQYEIHLENQNELNPLFIKRFCFIEHIVKYFIKYVEVEPNKKVMKIYISKEMNSLIMRIKNDNDIISQDYSYNL